MPPMRDYLYLDGQKLQDYSAGIDLGDLQSIIETATRNNVRRGPETPALGTAPRSGADEVELEATRERVMSVSDRHGFSAFYTAVSDSLRQVDELSVIDLDEFEKNALVDITREFEHSSINEIFDSIAATGALLQQASGLPDIAVDQLQVQQVLTMLSLFTNSNRAEGKLVPMMSEPVGADDSVVLFIAQERSILVPMDEFEGEMTVVGKVVKKIPAGKSIDLIDELKIMPRNLRRIRTPGSPKEAMVTMLGTIPESLGGPMTADALSLSGPAMMVSPLAVFK